jgi:Tol biopolymer transport system component
MRCIACLITLVLSCNWAVARAGSGATAPVRFLTADHFDLWPCFSPDGREVLFSRRDETTATFWVVSVARGQPRPFSVAPLPVAATRANWSRQNNQIAFTGIANGRNQVWLIDGDGSKPRAVTATGLSDQVFYPSWYPDGSQLAVMDARDLVIKKIDLGGATAVPITQHAQVMTGMPSVSPDGKWIAFAGQENHGQPYDQTKNSIWLVEETGVARRLEATPAQGRAPAGSPDGRRIAFESNRGSVLGWCEVFLINRDGTGLAQVTNSSLNADHPVWSPDGRELAISARPSRLQKERGIAIIDLSSAPLKGSPTP